MWIHSKDVKELDSALSRQTKLSPLDGELFWYYLGTKLDQCHLWKPGEEMDSPVLSYRLICLILLHSPRGTHHNKAEVVHQLQAWWYRHVHGKPLLKQIALDHSVAAFRFIVLLTCCPVFLAISFCCLVLHDAVAYY